MADNQPYNEPARQAARWMTFAELAAIRGISKLSAVALVRRHGWRRQRDNQGHMTALVPPAWADTEPTNEPIDQAAHQADISLTARSLAALEDAVAALREAKDSEIATLHDVIDGLRASIARAEDRAGRAETDRDAERSRAERAEQGRDDERTRADALRAQIDVLNAEMVADRAEADRAMADERQRADRSSERVDTLQAEIRQAEARAEGTDADRRAAEARVEAERARADALRTTIDELKATQALAGDALRQAQEAHSGEVSALKAERHRLATQIDGFATRADQAEARTDSLRARVDVLQRERDTARAEAQEAAMELRQAEAQQRARGLVARLRAVWRGE